MVCLVAAFAAPAAARGGVHSYDSITNATAQSFDGASNEVPSSYYNHADHKALLYAHIGLMVVAWVVLLPIGVFLSSAKSQLTVLAQLVFLIINAAGIGASIIYNAQTPDLYPSNAHHNIGWIVTWTAVAWTLIRFWTAFNSHDELSDRGRISTFATHRRSSQHQLLQQSDADEIGRWSEDSGIGSSRAHSTESVLNKPEANTNDIADAQQQRETHQEESRADRFKLLATRYVSRLNSSHLGTAATVLYVVLERAQVLLSFLALCTGFVTWWHIFANRSGLLSGLAHWIKGGIFVWYGFLTLGRWMGAFLDYGWAWNIRMEGPSVSDFAARMPSAEFVESFVIFLYGASNVFLEHISNWGGEWSSVDLEHISITIMFFGGGLLGMAIESKKIRSLLDTRLDLDPMSHLHGRDEPRTRWAQPKTYQTSLNPLPALVIFLLGLLMSNHHQSSMTSTMIHKQWGILFSGFALARLMTYITIYVRPLASYYPSRPPTELVTAFCLICGGFVFMASTSDVVVMLDRNGLHAMFILTITIGLTCLLMVWAVVLYALRGWAIRWQIAGARQQ